MDTAYQSTRRSTVEVTQTYCPTAYVKQWCFFLFQNGLQEPDIDVSGDRIGDGGDHQRRAIMSLL